MPANPRRRAPRERRRLPPRPTYADAPRDSAESAGTSRAALDQAQRRAARERALVISERESRYLVAEMRRVLLVSSACLGLLAVLAVVQHLT